MDSLFILRLAVQVKSVTCADFLQGSGVCSPHFTESSDGNVVLGPFMANDGRHSLRTCPYIPETKFRDMLLSTAELDDQSSAAD